MNTTTIAKRAPQLLPVQEADNQRRAKALIEEAIALAKQNGMATTTAGARILAATIHQGPTTALCQFAATGTLEQLQATAELWGSSVNEVPVRWWRALDLYLQQEALDGAA